MPLKHGQETRLIVLLSVAIIAAGIVVATLPPLPGGGVQWGAAFLVSLLYPVLVYPTLRRNRADYAFRLMHWVPVGILLLWLALGLLGLFDADLHFFVRWMTWGWSLPLVTLGFLWLITFCIQVVRRRQLRMVLLALLFVPFAMFAMLSEQEEIKFNRQIAAAVWDAPLWSILQRAPGGAEDLGETVDRGRDTSSSSQRAIAVLPTSATSIDEGASSSLPRTLQPGGTGAYMRDVASRPNGLPEAGFGWGAIALLLMAGYCGTLHARARSVSR